MITYVGRIAEVTICFLALACATPGADRRGRDFIATGNKIVAALETKRTPAGAYPTSLAELPDAFDLGEPGTDHDFLYRATADGFQLILTYTPSWPNMGRVSCGFESNTKQWKCGGYV